jgi:O-glycosyl hydrolase
MRTAGRALTLVMVASLMLVGSGSGASVGGAVGGPWVETRFQTGCDPGPYDPPPPPEHLETHYPPLGTTLVPVSIQVDLGPDTQAAPILGTGFNFEHALWSCPEFRGLFRSEILDPFAPSIARVDTGLLPAAPAELPAQELGPAVYQSVLSSAPYADSWRFLRRLDRAGVKIVLGVWGGPAQFTDDGTRRGTLLPSHYDDYVDYVFTVVDFIVRQNVPVWATTIANEPDGGDGNRISPDGLAYIAHQLAPRLAAIGVKLYGPDTASAADALAYLPVLLEDPVIAGNLAFIGFHQYYPSADVASVVEVAHGNQPRLPVIVTEYTSFAFGDLDAGEEANAQNGFVLDIASTLLTHYRYGADAALYWDAVDYLQPGHDAITKWGLLRGPANDFERRQRYYGLRQILPYLQEGAQVLRSEQEGDAALTSLAIRTPQGVPVIFLVNQDFSPLDLRVTLAGVGANQYRSMAVTRTERSRRAEQVGRVRFADGVGQLTLPPRSISTLIPAGAQAIEEDDTSAGS